VGIWAENKEGRKDFSVSFFVKLMLDHGVTYLHYNITRDGMH